MVSMLEQEIVCPYCGRKIALTESLMHPIEEKFREEYEEKEKNLERKMKLKENELEKKRKELENAEEIIEKRVQDKLLNAKEKD